MAVVLAPLGEGNVIGRAVAVEHLGRRAIAGDAFAAQVANVHRHGGGPVAAPSMSDDPGLHDHAPRPAPATGGGVAPPPRPAPA